MMSQIPTTEWGTTVQTLIGMVGVLGVIYLGMQVALSSRSLFGKRPPVDDQIRRLEERLEESVRECNLKIERQRKETEHLITELVAELRRERREDLNGLYQKINKVAEDVAFIRGNMATD